MTMQLAIQETMLPGRTVQQRCENARRAGLVGIEVYADGLTARVPEVAAALAQTGLAAAAVNLGHSDGYLSPDMAERERAVGRLRQAMADAVDLGARHVVFVPHYGPARMPDLRPYRAPVELDAEMMIWLLRTVSDLAYALGVELNILPVNHYETYFINRLEQAAAFRRKVKDHAHIKLAANLFHMALEEHNPVTALRDHAADVGYIQLADTNCRLPGDGLADFHTVAGALRYAGYDGWLTLAADTLEPAAVMAGLPASLKMLHRAGVK
jgi:sugar phosphate isomerase/epimerase